MFFIRQPSCAKPALSKLRFSSVETLDEQKLSEKVKDSDFTEIDLIVKPYVTPLYRKTSATNIQ